LKLAFGVKTGGFIFLLGFAVFMFDNCHLDALKIISFVIFGLDTGICCSRYSGQAGVWHVCKLMLYFFYTESVCC